MRAFLIASTVLACAAASLTPVAGQQLMALRAEWGDLQTWTTDIGNTREQEVGLGLHLSGSSGPTLLGFIARVNTRTPTAPPSSIVAQIALGSLTNPNVVRQPTLAFVINPDGAETSRLDLSGQLLVDDSVPGGSVSNGIATLPVEDFARLASAETLEAQVFGFDGRFRSDQLRALQDFAKRLNVRLDP